MPKALVWGNYPEGRLAAFQRNQGRTNNCGEFAVAAALGLLRGAPLDDYAEVVDVANRWTVLHSVIAGGLYGLTLGRSFRLWPGGPTTPRQQASLARYVGRRHGLRVRAREQRGESAAELLHLLQQPDTAVLVTIGWDTTFRPKLTYPDNKARQLTLSDIVGDIDSPFEAHVMVLAAYDPNRVISQGDELPQAAWGFINSWVDAEDAHGRLFWMAEADFLKTWRFRIPLTPNNLVVVTRHAKPT